MMLPYRSLLFHRLILRFQPLNFRGVRVSVGEWFFGAWGWLLDTTTWFLNKWTMTMTFKVTLLKEAFVKWIFDIDIRPKDNSLRFKPTGSTKRNPSNTSQQRIYTTLAKQQSESFRIIKNCRIFTGCCSGVFVYGGRTRLAATRKRSNNMYSVQGFLQQTSTPAVFSVGEEPVQHPGVWPDLNHQQYLMCDRKFYVNIVYWFHETFVPFKCCSRPGRASFRPL